jgi:hypothetical protein
MRTFAYKTLIFLVLMYIIDKPIGYLISQGVQHKQVDNRLDLLAKGELDKEILIIGSSRAVNDISPEVFEKQLGKTAYNLGYSGSNLTFHKSIFKFILARQHPETLILTLDGDKTFVPSEKGIYRKDKLAPYLSHYMILAEYCSVSTKHHMASKFSWMYRENQNLFPALDYLKNGRDAPDETTNINAYGAIFLPTNEQHVEEVPHEKQTPVYDKSIEEHNRLASFEFIVTQSAENNITLYIVIPPNYQMYSPGFVDRVHELVNGRCKVLDFSNQLQEKSLYFDNGHLNRNGAIVLSERIAEQL